MTAVGFEPTQLALVELESTPLDHSGKLSSTSVMKLLFLIFAAASNSHNCVATVFASDVTKCGE